MTPRLALGGEAFWLGQQRKSGTGFAARLHDDKSVTTAQIASTGLVSLAYVHRVSDKVGGAARGTCPNTHVAHKCLPTAASLRLLSLLRSSWLLPS